MSRNLSTPPCPRATADAASLVSAGSQSSREARVPEQPAPRGGLQRRLALLLAGFFAGCLAARAVAADVPGETSGPDARELARRVADAVLRDAPEPPPFDWGEGVLLAGLMRAHRVTGEARYLEFVRRFAAHWAERGIGPGLAEKGYCGHWGPAWALWELHEATGDLRPARLAEQVVDFLLHRAERTREGGLSHFNGKPQLWVDTLAMVCPVLAHGARLRARPQWQEEAERQWEIFAARLADPHTGLWVHLWDEATNQKTTALWARGNGWVVLSGIEMLRNEAADSPRARRLRERLGPFLRELARWQDPASGLWHTVLDAPETHLETSASALFLYGLIEAPRLRVSTGVSEEVLHRAWAGLARQVDAEGRVGGVSAGTIPGDKARYAARPLGSYPWGTGAFLLAAAARAEAEPVRSPEAALDAARRGIETHRKGVARLSVRHADGTPTAGVAVEVRQRAHEFRFGNAFRPRHYTNEVYRARFLELFNFVSLLEFNWGQYEPEEGRPRHADRLEFIRGWCREHGLTRFYGHMLVWTSDAAGRAGPHLPRWLFAYDPETQRQRLRERIQREVRAFADVDMLWDVVNEAVHCRPWGRWDLPGYLDAPLDEVVPYVRDALNWARAAHPAARLLINDYAVVPRGRYRDRFAELIRRLLTEGAPLDAIGIQAHEPNRGGYWFSPLEIWEACETFGTRTGRPIYFTEFCYTSDPARDIAGTWRRGRWSPERQAEAVEEFYRVAFGHPAVEGIIYFGMGDDDPPWLPGLCLRDERFEPKPVWHRLHRLIREEWMTRFTAETDAEGALGFRGFHGEYIVRVRAANRTWEFVQTLRSRAVNDWSVTLDGR